MKLLSNSLISLIAKNKHIITLFGCVCLMMIVDEAFAASTSGSSAMHKIEQLISNVNFLLLDSGKKITYAIAMIGSGIVSYKKDTPAPTIGAGISCFLVESALDMFVK